MEIKKPTIEEIKKIIEEALSKMDFEGGVLVNEDQAGIARFNIQTTEAGYLIGAGGETLKALQQLIRLMVNKGQQETVKFTIDVNDYQKLKLVSLIDQAKMVAEEVLRRGDSRWLAPMNSYERRVVHTALAEISGIKTESRGEGEERRIIISPAA